MIQPIIIFNEPAYLFKAATVFDGRKEKAKASAYYKKYLQQVPVPTTENQKKLHAYIKKYLE